MFAPDIPIAKLLKLAADGMIFQRLTTRIPLPGPTRNSTFVVDLTFFVTGEYAFCQSLSGYFRAPAPSPTAPSRVLGNLQKIKRSIGSFDPMLQALTLPQVIAQLKSYC